MPMQRTAAIAIAFLLGGCLADGTGGTPGLTLTVADHERGLRGTYISSDGTRLQLDVAREGAIIVARVDADRDPVIAFRADEGDLLLRFGEVDARVALAGDDDERARILAYSLTPRWRAYLELRQELASAVKGSEVALHDYLSALDVPVWVMADLGGDVVMFSATPGPDTCVFGEPCDAGCGQGQYSGFVEGSEGTDTQASCDCPEETPAPAAGQLEHHPNNCLGECGVGCSGIGGLHLCTASCLAHDSCVRGQIAAGRSSWFAHACCLGGLPAAGASFTACLANPAACSCTGPHN